GPRLRVVSAELVGIRERQRIEEHTVDDGEERGVRADAQGQRQNSDRREAGILSQHAQSVADILPETHHRLSSQIHPQGGAGRLEEETRVRRLLFLKMRMKPSSRRIALVAHCRFEGAAIPGWTLKCLLRATVRRGEELVGGVRRNRGEAGGGSGLGNEAGERFSEADQLEG